MDQYAPQKLGLVGLSSFILKAQIRVHHHMHVQQSMEHVYMYIYKDK